MRATYTAALAAGCLVIGAAIGIAAKEKGPGMDAMRGKPPKERVAGNGTWELLGVARVYYLSGDKAKGQALIDRVLGPKAQGSDWQRVGEIYADAGERQKAEDMFQKMLALDVKGKDDTGRAEIGAWYIRIGERDKGEELLSQAIARNPDEVWHYVRAAESYLGVPPGR